MVALAGTRPGLATRCELGTQEKGCPGLGKGEGSALTACVTALAIERSG